MPRKPRALRPGDTLGIVAPSSPVEEERLRRGIERIEVRGYRVVVGDHVLAKAETNSYLAGSDAQRAADINRMFERPDIDGILCARGGYGAMRLVDLLNWEIIAREPKILAGYSDITSLHLMLSAFANTVTFHGPVVTSLPGLDETSAEVFWRMLENPAPYGELPADPAAFRTLVPGIAEGELAGGCLCLLARACGSRFAPCFRGKIVLIEDVGESIYRADRDLIQLRNAGLLDDAAGFVVGTVTGWQKLEEEGGNTPDALWQDVLAPLGKPTITGYPFGHEPNPLTFPLGVRARLDADAGSVTLLDSAVSGG